MLSEFNIYGHEMDKRDVLIRYNGKMKISAHEQKHLLKT